MTLVLEGVFNQEWHLVGQADLDLVGEGRGLAEVDKVFEGERQRDRLAELNIDIQLGLVDVGMASEGDGTVTDVACAAEFDAVLARIDRDCNIVMV